MFNFFKKKELELSAPVDGKMIDLSFVPDKVFASKMMGEGVAFHLEDGMVCAPCDGIITLIPNTLHAFGIQSENEAEILVHIGLDTVNLNGDGFTKLVEQGCTVKRGTPIIKVDINKLLDKNINLTTPMVITNSADYDITILRSDNVKVNENIIIKLNKK